MVEKFSILLQGLSPLGSWKSHLKGNSVVFLCIVFLFIKKLLLTYTLWILRIQSTYLKSTVQCIFTHVHNCRGTRDQIANICWIIEKAREFQKNYYCYFCFIDYAKTFDCVDHNKLWKIQTMEKRWDYQTTLPASWETCMQVKKQQLEPDTEEWTGSKLGKEHVKAVYCHPAHLTYMQSTSCEMSGWMNHKLELRFPGEISITSDM